MKHDLSELLAGHPFLQGLRPDHLALITGCAKNIRAEEGEYLFRQGEEANEFFIIRHGRLTIEAYHPTKGPMVIETLSDGDVLGWSWLIPPYKWQFDSRALELTRAISLDGKCLRNKCEADHDFGYEILKRFSHNMTNMLQVARVQLLDLYGK